MRPGLPALGVAQDRAAEKRFVQDAGVPTAPFRVVRSAAEARAAQAEVGPDVVLKTTREGYDGKGQRRVSDGDAAARAFEELGAAELVVEALVDLDHEVSVIVARGLDGATVAYGPLRNDHANHILDVTVHPGVAPDSPLGPRAIDVATRLATELDVVGLLCVEFFVTRGGELLVNEMAPRPHNSGHVTMDACATSQFEQVVRAICGLPLGAVTWRSPVAMANLLGDLWQDGEPAWPRALALPDVHLHLYGKAEARPGRKMGHLNVLRATAEAAAEAARHARAETRPPR